MENVSHIMPEHAGRFLIVCGTVLIAAGLAMVAGSKWGFFGLGRLPGDIAYRGRNFRFYFPVASCIVVSGIVTLVLWFVSLLARK